MDVFRKNSSLSSNRRQDGMSLWPRPILRQRTRCMKVTRLRDRPVRRSWRQRWVARSRNVGRCKFKVGDRMTYIPNRIFLQFRSILYITGGVVIVWDVGQTGPWITAQRLHFKHVVGVPLSWSGCRTNICGCTHGCCQWHWPWISKSDAYKYTGIKYGCAFEQLVQNNWFSKLWKAIVLIYLII